jgi:hypothetical protein
MYRDLWQKSGRDSNTGSNPAGATQPGMLLIRRRDDEPASALIERLAGDGETTATF